MMKNLFWALIGVAVVIIFAQGYALYKIPQVLYISGQLTYNREVQIEPGTIFKLSLESRPQGDKKFNILSASERNIFHAFPQNFTLPILKKSLSATGIYQLRTEIFKENQLLYSNRELLPLTRDELNRAVSVAMQAAVHAAPAVSVAVAEVPVAIPDLPPVKPAGKAAPPKLDIAALLGNRQWLIEGQGKNRPTLTFDIEKGRVFGNAGCNDFQGGYQIDESALVMKHFIASAKRCTKGMDAEANFIAALNKVSRWSVDQGMLSFYDQNQLLLLRFNSL